MTVSLSAPPRPRKDQEKRTDQENQEKRTLLDFRTLLYDAAGNLTSHRDAQNNVTTFAYDSLNRKTRETDPLSEAATFTYNAVGLLTSTTDRLGRRRDFQYDAANRLTTETWFTSGTAVETILYSYDAVGNTLTAQNGVGTYTMTYDAVNRVTVVNGLWGVTLTMAYDAVGNRTQVEDSFGGVVTSTYDNANRLTQRQLDAGTPEIRVDQTYNKANQIETMTRWSDLSGSTKVGSTTYTYDAVNRVTAMDHRDGSGTLLATYLYSYKDNGELLTQKINGGATTTYGYDAASQLTADGATNYTYDGTGNRTISGYSTGTGNRLTTDGTWDYSYDDEGNRTQQSLGQNAETWEYAYDHRNQMTSAKQYSAAAGSPRELWSWTTYRYDANGNRVEKVIESVEVDEDFSSFVPLPGAERYALDGWKTGPQGSFVGLENWDVWADLDGENALQVRYLRGDVIDQLFARIASGSAKWELVDRLGSVMAETDSAGAVESNITYDGFGNAVSGSLPGRYQYTGREKDVETGLQYNRGRYLDTLVARWTSTDPLGFNAGDSNLYRYVHNSPSRWADPSGLEVRYPDQAKKEVREYISARLKEMGEKLPGKMADKARVDYVNRLLTEIVNTLHGDKTKVGTFEYETPDQFLNDVLFRFASVEYARELLRTNPEFVTRADVKEGRLAVFPKSEYWTQSDKIPGSIYNKKTMREEPINVKGLVVTAGKQPAAAIRNFFQTRGAHLDCATAQVVIYRRALLDIGGTVEYNLRRANRTLAGFLIPGDLGSAIRDKNIRAAIPGDAVDFENPDGEIGFTNENTIYLGDGLYYGHGIGIKTENQMREALNGIRVDNPKQKALPPNPRPSYLSVTSLPLKYDLDRFLRSFMRGN